MEPFTDFTSVTIAYLRQGEGSWTRPSGWYWTITSAIEPTQAFEAHGPHPNYRAARDNFEKEYVR